MCGRERLISDVIIVLVLSVDWILGIFYGKSMTVVYKWHTADQFIVAFVFDVVARPMRLLLVS